MVKKQKGGFRRGSKKKNVVSNSIEENSRRRVIDCLELVKRLNRRATSIVSGGQRNQFVSGL